MDDTTKGASRRDFLQDLTAMGAVGIGGSLLLAACGRRSTPDEKNGSPDDAERQAVEQINQIRREWERAENEGDPSIIDRHAADDVIAMPLGMPPSPGLRPQKSIWPRGSTGSTSRLSIPARRSSSAEIWRSIAGSRPSGWCRRAMENRSRACTATCGFTGARRRVGSRFARSGTRTGNQSERGACRRPERTRRGRSNALDASALSPPLLRPTRSQNPVTTRHLERSILDRRRGCRVERSLRRCRPLRRGSSRALRATCWGF